MSPLAHPYRIVASDLDGTLLAPNHQLTAFAKSTLKALHEQGHTFVFATGRHHIDVANIRAQVGIPAYMITANGACVHDENDALMYKKSVPSDLVQAVIDCAKHDPEVVVHLYQGDNWMINRENDELKEYHEESGFSYHLFNVDQAPTSDIAKIFFTHDGRDGDYLVALENTLNATFGDNVSIAFSTPWCLEVMADNVSKGEALNAVAQALGSSLDQCIAFGDGMNDVEMLSMAGKGLVMATAHPRVKAALPNNEIIGSHADDAVVHYLRDHLL
ncbi:Cof-type HAD-IIB family hydrolase [Vibrio sp. SM6]|uniref:Cof-type HAD-IIB family hydrolase n=1 Tax=Vibrio agarilyticus TaxID=2726741 RepID=A0A7X8TRI1_9VIBR|nr:Cof-type HAD-IIB family hydrolase [Vibrio agarilyticus]NLS13647.1 Cof-type HAD-IIB family hydrolase [Vibrio agarilyticus]